MGAHDACLTFFPSLFLDIIVSLETSRKLRVVSNYKSDEFNEGIGPSIFPFSWSKEPPSGNTLCCYL
jgi:hypothetical protein